MKKFYKKKGLKRYLNAGFSVGRRTYMCNLAKKRAELRSVFPKTWECQDEQALAHAAFLLYEKIVELDMNSTLIMSTFYEDEIYFDKTDPFFEQRLISRLWNGTPCFIHGNGSKDTFFKYLRDLLRDETEFVRSAFEKTFFLNDEKISFRQICEKYFQ